MTVLGEEVRSVDDQLIGDFRRLYVCSGRTVHGRLKLDFLKTFSVEAVRASLDVAVHEICDVAKCQSLLRRDCGAERSKSRFSLHASRLCFPAYLFRSSVFGTPFKSHILSIYLRRQCNRITNAKICHLADDLRARGRPGSCTGRVHARLPFRELEAELNLLRPPEEEALNKDSGEA